MGRAAARWGAFGAAYAGALTLSLALRVGPPLVLTVNLAAGLVAALVVARPGRPARGLLPYLAVAGLVTVALRTATGLSPGTAALLAAGNVVEGLVLAVLVRGYAAGPGLSHARRTVTLLACTGLAAAAGALAAVPALVLLAGPAGAGASFAVVFWCRVAADVLGMVTAGAVVLWLPRVRDVPGRTWLELGGWLLPLSVTTWTGVFADTPGGEVLPYLPLAILLVAVLRLGTVTTGTLTTWLVLVTVTGTAAGRTVFTGTGPGSAQAVVEVQSYCVVVTVAACCAAAVTADRSAAVEALRSESASLADRVEQQRLALAHVEELTAHVGEARGLEQVLDRMLPRLARIVGADAVRVLLLDREDRVLVGGGSLGLDEERREGTRIAVGTGFAGTVAATGRPWVVDDLRTVDVRSRALRESGLRSLVGVPLLADGEVVGVLHVGSRRPAAFSGRADDPVPWLERVAEPIAAAVARDRLAADLARSDARGRAALDELLDAVTLCRPVPDGDRGNGDFTVVYANHAAQAWGSRVGMTIAGPLGQAGLGHLVDAYRRAYADGEAVVLDAVRLPPAPGTDTDRWLDMRLSRRGDELLVTWRDVTARRHAQDELARRALHDGLTGLANRHLLMDHLRLALRELDRTPGTVALLLLDLDKFKDVNDSLGHAAGDEVIREVGQRLDEAVRGPDTAARLAGDEFVVVARVRDDVDAVRLAERLVAVIGRPMPVRGRRLEIRPSVGVTTTSDPHADADALLREADLAMYQSKRGGPRPWELYDDALHRRALERLAVTEELRAALAHERFRLLYQPVVDLRSGRVVGAEALLRLEHPDHGLLAPAAFIDVAEDSDLIVPIGGWVLEEACRQLARWHADPATAHLHVAVNVSGRQAGHGVVREQVRRATDGAGVDPRHVVLEITERVLVEAPGDDDDLFSVTDLGCRIAIDDFGTGWSSLAYLKRLPVSTVKIDRSFVEGLGRHGDDTAIVEAVTGLARTLDLTCVAEGVETAGQVAELRRVGCHSAQGYHYGRPMPAGELAALAAAGRAGSR